MYLCTRALHQKSAGIDDRLASDVCRSEGCLGTLLERRNLANLRRRIYYDWSPNDHKLTGSTGSLLLGSCTFFAFNLGARQATSIKTQTNPPEYYCTLVICALESDGTVGFLHNPKG